MRKPISRSSLRRRASAWLWRAAAAVASLGCAAETEDFDSESHFACQADDECAASQVCRAGACVFVRAEVAPTAPASELEARPGSEDPFDADAAGDSAVQGTERIPFDLIAEDEEGLYDIAVDATHIYWVDSGMSVPETTAAVRRVPRAGGTIETLDEGAPRSYTLALDADNVYVAYITEYEHDGTIVVIPKDGRPKWDIVYSFNPIALATADGWLYYNEAISPGGKIWRVPTSGGTPEIVVQDVDGPWDFVSDGLYLYYSEMNQGRIRRVPVEGGLPVTLAEGWIGTGAIALAGDDVLFEGCSSGPCEPGILYRVPRSGGAVSQVLTVSSSERGANVAASSAGIAYGQWVTPSAGAPLRIPWETENRSFVWATDENGIFAGEFFTGRILRLRSSM